MLKRVLTGVVSVVLVISMLLTTACSTPDVALTVNKKDISMGEYLAYVYETFYAAYVNQGLYQYAAIGQDVWSMKFSYGEGDDAEELSFEEYLRQAGKDLAIRQVALAEMMEKYDLEWDKDDVAELQRQLDEITEASLIQFGFNKESYKNAVFSVELNEQTVFYGLYGKDGDREVAEKDIKKYYEDNYLSYMSIEISLQDDKGKDLSDDRIDSIQNQLKSYLEMYEETGDFDAVIEKYKKDEEANKEDDKEEDTSDDKKEESTDDKKEDASDDKKEESTDDKKEDTSDDKKEESDKDDKEEKEESANRIDTTVDYIGDKGKSDAIKKVKIGEAEIVKYEVTSGEEKKPMIALILRLDPDKRVDEVDYYEENREAILRSLKYEEFNEELDKYIAKMDVKVDEDAISMAEPKEFENAFN